MEEPKPKRRPGRPKKVTLPTVVEAVMPTIAEVDEPPPLESAPVSPVGPVGVVAEPEVPKMVTGPTGPPEEVEPPLNPLPAEPPMRYPNHLSVVELRREMTRYAGIVGGRMRQIVEEFNRRFPFQC